MNKRINTDPAAGTRPISEGPRRRISLGLLLLCVAVLYGSPCRAVSREIPIHLDPLKGALRDPDLPRGACNQCHLFRSGRTGPSASLWTGNDNTLCYQCHAGWSRTGIYPGQQDYELSTHQRDSRMVWPGPRPKARLEPDAAGKCVNCHDPHGIKDRFGLIPALLFRRDSRLCLTCHNGRQSRVNLEAEFRKPYRHPLDRSVGRHRPGEGNHPGRYGISNRHVSCSDCHNPHTVRSDAVAPKPPDVSNRNRWVSGVRVINRGAGSIPSYIYRSPLDRSTPLKEYEICFKCHSSWTVQPPGQTDLAKFLNPNNPSYHPVESLGKDLQIPDIAFVRGWTARKMTYCGDCHGSDDSNIRGPHGSLYPNLLHARYPASSNLRSMGPDELCFSCHNYKTYSDSNAAPAILEGSRWNPPMAANGHAYHVGDQRTPCYACHDSHASTSFPALIRTGRTPGLRSFTQSPGGGSCTATCHPSRSYRVNYSR